MPWTTEDDVNLAEAPYVASAGSVTDVRGWFEESRQVPEDSQGTRHEFRQYVFQCKPGAFGALEIDQRITINGVSYKYLGEAPHGPSIWAHLLLMREVT